MDCKGKWKKVKAFSMKKGECCSSSSGSSSNTDFAMLYCEQDLSPRRRMR